MPRNFKEEALFTMVMAGLMVFGMTFYNVVLNNGLSANTLMEVLTGFPLALAVALLADTLVVGPIAKKIAFKILPVDASQIRIGLTISALMVAGMVTIMSLFGVTMAGNLSVAAYFIALGLNVIVALPLQMLVVGNIARFLLKKVQLRANATLAASESEMPKSVTERQPVED
jgi:hypothetical protein